MKNKFTMSVLAVAVLAALPFVSNAEQDDKGEKENNDVQNAKSEFLVRFAPNATDSDKARVLGPVNGQEIEKVRDKNKKGDRSENDVSRISHNRSDLTPEQIKHEIESDSAVEAVEINQIYHHEAFSNDPGYTNAANNLWGMYGATTVPTNQYGSGAGEAWASTTVNKTDCSSVYVGIIDEGYMYTHEDLAANAGKNPKEIAGNGKDDDLNGFKDDVYGWDFAGNNNTVFDSVDDDHGTHVAGTIGAVGNNGKGVAGVCWKVKLLNAKFLTNQGGTLANAIKAIDYFTNLKKAGVNIVATNNSWGGGSYSQLLYDAIERANQAGILFIAAAGNAGNNNDDVATPSYPASYPNSNVISVAAIDSAGALASFSNYGATSVHLAAPGVSILSTVPMLSRSKVVSGYAYYDGTSMATPHVTGAAALYAATHPGAPMKEIKDAILNRATSTNSIAGKTVTGARLNVGTF
jgi:subtilisin family serine protease